MRRLVNALGIKLFVAAVWLLVVGAAVTYYYASNDSRSAPQSSLDSLVTLPDPVEEPAVPTHTEPPPSAPPTPAKKESEPPPSYPNPPACARFYLAPSTPGDVSTQTQQFVEDYHEHHYRIYGHTREQTSNQLSECGVTVPDGRRFYGATWIQVSYWYWNKIQNDKCVISKINVRQTTDIVYPIWDANQNNPRESDLQTRWANYNRSIRIHEEGHRRHGYEVRDEILAFAYGLAGYATCDELHTVLTTRINSLLSTIADRGQAYDEATRGGITQLIAPHLLWP